MNRQNGEEVKKAVLFLTAWMGFLLLLDFITGVHWFRPGDFSYRTAMAYHGLMIPVWMLLLLIFSDEIPESFLRRRTLVVGVLSASVLTGAATLFIRQKGISFPTVILVSGLVIAEITALVVLISALRAYRVSSEKKPVNRLAWLTVFIALAGMSLATPAGHLVGAFQDAEQWFSGWAAHFQTDSLTDAHSHQMLASLLAAVFVFPLIKKSSGKQKRILGWQNIGLVLVLVATLAQIIVYQASAWIGWEPPVLFSHGLNGVPLDDAVLSVLGMGMLMLVPGLWIKTKDKTVSLPKTLIINRLLAVLLLAYLMSVVVLGIYIEFHEPFFGQAAGNAPGVPNDLAFIRGHLLLGFMLIPIIAGVLLNVHRFAFSRNGLFVVSVLLVVTFGVAGIFLWTFGLNPVLMQVAVYLTVVFLWVSAYLFRPDKKQPV
jgi:hypothetical protein